MTMESMNGIKIQVTAVNNSDEENQRKKFKGEKMFQVKESLGGQVIQKTGGKLTAKKQ